MPSARAISGRAATRARWPGCRSTWPTGPSSPRGAATLALPPSRSPRLEAITKATGTHIAPYAQLLLAAFRGQTDALPLIESTIRDAGTSGQGLGVQWAEWVSAILFNGLAHYDRALASAQRAAEETPQLQFSPWASTELVEAAVRSGRPEVAAGALERVMAATASCNTDWGWGIQARCRALLSEGESAERLHREAIERLARTRLRPELARAHLLYGEWLRRENRRVDAREQLRSAHEMLVTIGMEGFAERARKELQATGEKVRKRTVETRDDLTAAGAADRAHGPRGPIESGDRCAAVPQPADR